MSKASTILRLLGAFTIEVNAGRALAVAVRSRKARALIAYLAMTPDGRAGREELATLLWGDTPDAQARHSLRQCVMSLRQDLHLVAPDLIDADRDVIELRMDALAVDARELVSLAASTDADALARAGELWRGAFLADVTLDIEEFAAWREREQSHLADAAARAFEALCSAADTDGNGERAVAAAERLVALDPTREDRQRVALTICARYRGRDAALDRARRLTELLRSELAVAPDAATRALIESIRASDAPLPATALPAARDATAVEPTGTALVQIAPPRPLEPVPTRTRLPARPVWRRRPIAAALALVSVVSLGSLTALELVTGAPIPWSRLPFTTKTPALPGVARVAVLPFAVDAPRGADDQALARLVTHALTANLARFGELRVVADRTAELYGGREVAAVGAELGVPYAVVGHVQRTDGGLRADAQLIDTANQMTLWSDHLQIDGTDPARSAEEVARGLARALDVKLFATEALRSVEALRRDPGKPAPIADLLLRARLAETRGSAHANLETARKLYAEALRRAPHNAGAMLGVARTDIIATTNFIDADPPPDLNRAEELLAEVVTRFPQWPAAHYVLGLLQKYRRQYDASLQSFQRCLELNPSFLSAHAQIGNVLTRMGQPEKGLAAIQESIRLSTPSDPALGFAYLFAGEAELELGHEQAALRWVLRANSLMPNAPLVQAWTAGVYANMGDGPNAAKYAAVLKSMAPTVAQRLTAGPPNSPAAKSWPRRRIIEGLRVALTGPLG